MGSGPAHLKTFSGPDLNRIFFVCRANFLKLDKSKVMSSITYVPYSYVPNNSYVPVFLRYFPQEFWRFLEKNSRQILQYLSYFPEFTVKY